MLTRRFGRTELAMPVFSCGGMRYQFKWQDQPLSQVPADNQLNLQRTIERAVELGIKHIETARGYGSSERQLGPVLRRFRRQDLILQTKVGPTEDPAEFEKHFEESLERLQTDYVDLFAIHGVNNRQKLEQTLRPGGCFEVAQRLRRTGKCRFVGFSTHAALDVILEAIRHGAPTTGESFDYVNLHWYFIMQRNWPAVAEARARDMGVFIISPTDKGGRLYDPPELMKSACAPLSPMVFNDLFCLARPEISTLSIGAACPSDFDEHLKALPLLTDPDAHLKAPLQRLHGLMQSATGSPNPEASSEGLPDWETLPGQVNIKTILWLRNLAIGWGLDEFAKARYNLLSAGDDWFPGARPGDMDEDGRAVLVRSLGGDADAHGHVEHLLHAQRLLSGQQRQRLSKS